jgi:RimJ/RimL family protein N-acetyltransferase
MNWSSKSSAGTAREMHGVDRRATDYGAKRRILEIVCLIFTSLTTRSLADASFYTKVSSYQSLFYRYLPQLAISGYLPLPMPRIASFATDRLILRPPSPGDLDDFVALGADPEVMRYIGQGQTQSPVQAAFWLECLLADARHGIPVSHPDGMPGWLVVIERQTGAFVGLAVLTVLGTAHIAAVGAPFCVAPPVVEVGYRLARRFWGNGYATEAGAALVRHGFETMRLPQIAAIADVRNAASNRVIEKLGLVKRKMYELNGLSINFHSLSIEDYGQ